MVFLIISDDMGMKIGIVCEGISDYRVLKHITERYLRDHDVYVVPLKPKETPQGKQDGFGSWQGVLQYISGEDQMILEALNEGCQYVIVHIDTDVRMDYGVTDEFADISDLHASVVKMLLSRVPSNFDKSRLIFAIAINETECWLIPFVSDDKRYVCKINSCVATINHILKDKGGIDKDNKNTDKAREVYDLILKKKRKVKDLKEVSQFNFGFAHFIDSLERISL